jgi:hypothetical protein
MRFLAVTEDLLKPSYPKLKLMISTNRAVPQLSTQFSPKRISIQKTPRNPDRARNCKTEATYSIT